VGTALSVLTFLAKKKKKLQWFHSQPHKPKLTQADLFSPLPKIEIFFEMTSIRISSKNTRKNATAVSIHFLKVVLGILKKKKKKVFTILLMQKQTISNEIAFNL
jgi:hypothetical protein